MLWCFIAVQLPVTDIVDIVKQLKLQIYSFMCFQMEYFSEKVCSLIIHITEDHCSLQNEKKQNNNNYKTNWEFIWEKKGHIFCALGQDN